MLSGDALSSPLFRGGGGGGRRERERGREQEREREGGAGTGTGGGGWEGGKGRQCVGVGRGGGAGTGDGNGRRTGGGECAASCSRGGRALSPSRPLARRPRQARMRDRRGGSCWSHAWHGPSRAGVEGRERARPPPEPRGAGGAGAGTSAPTTLTGEHCHEARRLRSLARRHPPAASDHRADQSSRRT